MVTLATVVDSRHRLARTQSVLGSFWNAAKRTSDPAKLPQLGNGEVSTVEETVNYYLNVLKLAWSSILPTPFARNCSPRCRVTR